MRKKNRQNGARHLTSGGAVTPTAQPPVKSPQVTRREILLIAAVIAIGVLFRLVALAHSAVEHFDEGVYASNIYFPPPAYAYPQQRFYAPPLLPALIEAAMILGLSPNIAALLPSLLAGCGTIVAVWWLARSWFSPAAGLAAATLVAFSDFHVLLSTAALTDALLGLWLVLAVDAMARSLIGTFGVPLIGAGARTVPATFGDYRWAVGAGIYTGLAWWTKYNGWLPLAIEAAALPLLWLLLKPPARQLQTWMSCFAVAAITACVVWSPYFYSLQATGGYAPIAENHAKYVVGIVGWFESARRQISNHYAVEGWVTAVGVGLAVVLPVFLRAETQRYRLSRVLAGLILGWGTMLWSGMAILGLGAAVGLANMWRVALSGPIRAGNADRQRIALILLTVWWCGLLAVTPTYTPYARLTLPWLIASMLAAGLTMDEKSGRWALTSVLDAPLRWQWGTGSLLAAVFLAVQLFMTPSGFRDSDHRDRRGALRIAQQNRATGPANFSRAIFVYGEPALFFQLRAAGEEIVVPVDSVPTQKVKIDEREIPTHLVAGPHAQRDARFQEAMKDSTIWKLASEWVYEPSTLVWLDLNDPRKPTDAKESFKLFEMQQ